MPPSPSLTLEQMAPRADRRMVIAGATGSGKSTLAEYLLSVGRYRRVLVIDPKCEFGGPKGLKGYRQIKTPDELRRCGKEPFIQLRPSWDRQEPSDWHEAYLWAYGQGNIMVYTDEVFAVLNRGFATKGMQACLVQGRSRRVGMIMSTQRPHGLDLKIITESESVAMFTLRFPKDRKRIAEIAGPEVMKPLPLFAFWYWKAGMEKAVPAKLSLKGGT